MSGAIVYVSGALTNVSDIDKLREFYDAIGDVCREVGLSPYLPHQYSDPIINPDMSPREVYQRDKAQVLSSELLIAFVGIPSLGVGMEIAYADEHNIPIILIYPQGKAVSRMVRGLPSDILYAEIVFCKEADALVTLRSVLIKWREGRINR